ncbi:hypothetical protein Tco_1422349 [Tanacetum coccineum]
MEVSHVLRGDCRNCIPHSLPWRESLGGEGDRGQFYATRNYLKVLKYNWEKIPFDLEGEAFELERRANVENLLEYFNIYFALLVSQIKLIGGGILDLLDCVLELLHVYLWNISRDVKGVVTS